MSDRRREAAPDEEASPASPDRPRRPPTAAEAKALGHPLRLRILFACREQARTNKELAEALGTTPGTIHYHLRQLVDQGFLRPEEARPGPRGSTEQPYRATGKSWELSSDPAGTTVLREVAASEVLGARGEDVLSLARLGMSLPQPDLDELIERLEALVEEFAARSLTAPDRGDDRGLQDTESVTLVVSLQRSSLASTRSGGSGG